MLLRYIPINIFILLIIFSCFIYFIGPIRYVDFDVALLASFLLPLIFLSFLGFHFGVKGNIYKHNIRASSFLYLNKFLMPIVFLVFLLMIYKWINLFANKSPSDFLNFGQAYQDVYEDYERGSGGISSNLVINIFQDSLSMLAAIYCITSLYEHKTLALKMLFTFIVFSYVLIPVFETGKMKYVGDVAIFYFATYLIVFAQKKVSLNISALIKIFFIVLLTIFALGLILSSRYNALEFDVSNIANNMHPLIIWKEDSLIVKIFGNVLGLGFGMLTTYFTMGMYGLSICLSMPFSWTYMLGSSYSLGRIMEQMLGNSITIIENSYPVRAEEYGWGMDKWHSVYSWLASDFSFPGVLILCFFISFFYGRVWKRVIEKSNPIAPMMFVLLTLGMIFSLSNNQLLHSLQSTFVVCLVFVLYVISSRPNHINMK